jgi:hypothetical protein
MSAACGSGDTVSSRRDGNRRGVCMTGLKETMTRDHYILAMEVLLCRDYPFGLLRWERGGIHIAYNLIPFS